MSALLVQLEQQVRSLPPEDRAHLAEMLLESLQDTPLSEIESDWQREIERRVAAYEGAEARTYAAEDVFAEARRLAR